MTACALFFIRLWQRTFSPDHGVIGSPLSRCRFYPSCSRYAEESIRQYGLLSGLMFSLWRVLRCNPYGRGGYDPVIKNSERA